MATLGRNPKWHRDEIILALDLYFSEDRGSIDKKNPRIIEISQILNRLPLFPDRPDEIKFRNANGVTLKLSNFLAFDPDYKGKGMERGSFLDRAIFNEFYDNRQVLRNIANEIVKISKDEPLKQMIYKVEEDEQTLLDTVNEGQILYKLHKVRERKQEIVASKKLSVFHSLGKLECEACVFNFENIYGDLGSGYIECHHKTPLYSFKSETVTTHDDLAIVCANCHRMLHRSKTHLSIDDLKSILFNTTQH